jgi:hypothetical protein
MARFPPRSTLIRTAAILSWLASVATGMAVLSTYAGTAGGPATAPDHWPPDSTVTRLAGLPTLLVFAHPHCPCTRATLGEIDWVLAHASRRADVHVLLWDSENAHDAAAEPPLAALAAAIPTVHVVKDTGGREAARFGVATSGQVLLYDTDARLRFAGGVTGARGHAGANAGRERLLAHLSAAPADGEAAPVFGCALGGPAT